MCVCVNLFVLLKVLTLEEASGFLYHLSGWGLAAPEVNIAFYPIHCLDKSPDSVFTVSFSFEVSLTVALLAFYFTEVRTKQPTFVADLWKAIIIRPSGKKHFLGLEQQLTASFWRVNFLQLPHDSDSVL